MNEFISEGGIKINGKRVEINFYLSGDYKFLLMVMGINKASSNYARLWCTIHKDDQPDMSKGKEYYEKASRKRTLKGMSTC